MTQSGPSEAEQRAVLLSLRVINDCFDTLCQYAGIGAGHDQVPRFYRRRPLRPAVEIEAYGIDFTRCAFWRRFLTFQAATCGDFQAASDASTMDDDTIAQLFAERYLAI